MKFALPLDPGQWRLAAFCLLTAGFGDPALQWRWVARLLCGLAVAGGLHGQELRTLRDAGPTANRVNVVFVAEGYTAAETAKFFSDAQAKFTVVAGNEAFAAFADQLNGFALFVASNQSGSDIPARSITRDTYFNTTYGAAGLDRLLTIGGPEDSIRLNTLLRRYTPEYDLVILLVNATEYGGSGGFPVVVSLHTSSEEIMLHEIGHSFADLVDEYVDAATAPYYPPRESVNATQMTDRAAVPWAAFILPTTPVPTTTASGDANYVGLFEGAYYRAKGFYRPTYDSKMRTLGQPFGPVNVRAFTTALHALNLNSAAAAPSVAAVDLSSATVAAGETLTLTASAVGVGPLTYQWSFNGKFLAGDTRPTLTLANVSSATAGTYVVTITNAVGSRTVTLTLAATDATNRVFAVNGTVVPPLPPGRIVNLSIRSGAGTGAQTLIVGFVVAGDGKALLVRGVGPALTPLGVSGALADPRLSVAAASGAVLASNDNWGGALNSPQIAATAAQLGAFALPSGGLDAAVLTTLDAGAYTAQLTGANASPGVALVELYDAEPAAAARLVNVSARTQIGTGESALIAGFVIAGGGPRTVLLRAVGPTLGTLGVTGALATPQLDLRTADGAPLGSNADWNQAQNAAQIAATAEQVGAFALTPSVTDAALLQALAPGAYTVQVTGGSATTGVVLIEIYEVP
ncbi:MAG: hypothetical protein HZA31_11380 [Opitutae bacterium]|nr:hypothetical protein [Opitutae bacterium]